jgi:hypothetical protein
LVSLIRKIIYSLGVQKTTSAISNLWNKGKKTKKFITYIPLALGLPKLFHYRSGGSTNELMFNTSSASKKLGLKKRTLSALTSIQLSSVRGGNAEVKFTETSCPVSSMGNCSDNG